MNSIPLATRTTLRAPVCAPVVAIVAAMLAAPATTQSWVSTFGGSGFDYLRNSAIDAAGNIYVCGWTDSLDFPITAGAVQENHAGGPSGFLNFDGFVMKLNVPANAIKLTQKVLLVKTLFFSSILLLL